MAPAFENGEENRSAEKDKWLVLARIGSPLLQRDVMRLE